MHDLVILGGGPGGYAAALYAHNFGLSVALVSDERPGGTCLIRGCIPAKQWLQIAEVYSTVAKASDFGVMTSEPEMDWAAALARKNQTVEALVRGLGGLLKKRKVEVVIGRGRLDGPRTVVVETDEGERRLEGEKLVVSTGSYARTLPGYEIDGQRIVTSDHALDWPERPGRVAIIGGGVIGCEFASLLAEFGTEVHVIEMFDQIIPGSDTDSAKLLEKEMARKGTKFHLGAKVEAPQVGPSTMVVPFGGESVEADVVLMAVGRGPRTENVGLESADGLEIDRGFIKANLETMETGAAGVYAVGDVVAGTAQLAHVGFAEAIAAVTHLATGKSAPVNYLAIPRVTYTHPEFAEVGLTEAQARDKMGEVEVHTHGFVGVGRAIIIGQNRGSVKIVSQKGGPILGASVVGPQAGELIHELMYSVGWEAYPSEAASFIHAHPSLSEAVGESLLAASGRSLH
ncbi:MAG TPA: dihydrolipoyl dehydrogenase [Acidimicrobiia bacterium]|nr:dihydrolipoyl dehydrogenase [Acidimicrobiia bacterium]